MFLTALLSLASAERVGSFIVLGDWGYAGWSLSDCPSWACCHTYMGCGMNPTCQTTIADKMKEWVQANPDVKFVLNVGDSFYPNGIASPTSERWQQSWKGVYGDEITNLKWYSVYGNHDYEGKDYCACADPAKGQSVCAQLNGMDGVTHENLNGWYMPDLYYYDETYLQQFGIEIIGMDTNSVAESACKYQSCSRGQCFANLNARYSASMDLFATRMKRTQADNVLVFNHYPTYYFDKDGRESFIGALKNGAVNDAQLYFFGGHTHFVKEGYGVDISPAKPWLVGGGGGWGCDSWEQGFAVGIINKGDDGKFSIEMEHQLVETSECCYKQHEYEMTLEDAPFRVGTEASAQSLVESMKETCGGLECQKRQDLLKEARQNERLRGASTESTSVKKALEDEAERDTLANFEPSQYFKDTIEEIKQAKAARRAAASTHEVQVE